MKSKRFEEMQVSMGLMEYRFVKENGKDYFARQRQNCKTADDHRRLSKEIEKTIGYLMRMSELLADMADELEDCEEG